MELEKLKKAVDEFMRTTLGSGWDDKHLDELPKKWEMHGRCVLFNSKAFKSPIWPDTPQFFNEVAKVFGVEVVARKSGSIKNDGFRRPSVQLLHGSGPVVTKKENGITYIWDITQCMFSSGNVTEKQRIAKLNCKDQVVVDLYAGIGYFSLTYLVHCQAKFLYACEWNPQAVKWLDLNLKLNNVANKCKILQGDNLTTCPKGVADHVNLGLIPSSEASWGVAAAALKTDTGGTLHIHGNVNNKKDASSTQHEWTDHILDSLKQYFSSLYPEQVWSVNVVEVAKVKSYGPRIDHLVAVVQCRPDCNTIER